MKIINTKVFIDGKFHDDLEVKFDHEKIIEIGQNLIDDEVIDGEGNYLYAGIIDAHIHGGWLRNFTISEQPTSFGEVEEQTKYVCARLPQHGVTTIFPTFAGNSYEKRCESLKRIRAIKNEIVGADPLKFHFECTYMSLDRYITPDLVNPSIEHTNMLVDNDYSDIGFICLAPDLEGSMEWIDYVSSKGVMVEVGYTKCSAEQIIEAADHGASHCSHIFNGYQPMHHRESSPAVGIMLDDRIKAQITMDGYHVNPAWVKLVLKTKGINNCYGITDQSAYSGLEEGVHNLEDGSVITAKDGFIYSKNGHIMSGNMTMDQIMNAAKNRVGLTMEEVGTLYTENPAKLLGIKDRGKIEIGRRSDFVLMDKDYKVLKTIILGEVYYENK